ncbi:MAG: 16S rRNA (uracil(1498)-N(3))-methyltransferase [Pseudorhodoplanes sp.]
MPRYDFRSPRLYRDVPLAAGGRVPLDKMAANYLLNVLRLSDGAGVLVFNGRDGEWQAQVSRTGKRDVALAVGERTRSQSPAADLHYLFAPLKQARLDYMVQKAVELGVSHLRPVLTRHTQAARVNLERMRANVIEACEQCGVLAVPVVEEPVSLERVLAAMDPSRVLVFCDEAADVADPVGALSSLRAARAPLSVLIGPEGGFAEEERSLLLKHPRTVRLALGPRILRADTAAVSALTLVQAVLGDWRGGSGGVDPAFAQEGRRSA